MRRRALALLLLLSCAAFLGLKLRLDNIQRKKIPGSTIIYIPSGKYLKFASFGYSSILADLVYLWAIQYYGNTLIEDRFNNLDHIFTIITELDSRYLDPYELGALIAVYEAKDPELAFKILNRGLEKNPGQWIFPFQAGHYALMVLKDYGRAGEFFKKAMEMPDSPPIARRLSAHAAYLTLDYQTAWQNWLEIYQTAPDERIKKIASNHLYQVKAAIDIQTLQYAIEKFKERFGKNPQVLTDLVLEGLLSSLPQDLDGKDYIYDPETAAVKAPVVAWKR